MQHGWGGLRTRIARAAGSLVGAALLTVAAGAAADVVLPPPDDCPPGSHPYSDHGGPYCAADYCPDAGTCESPGACETLAYCVLERYWPPGVYAVRGSCEAGQECDAGACETLDLCVGGPRPSTPPSTGATGGSAGTGGGLVLLGGTGGTAGTAGPDAGDASAPPLDPVSKDSGCGCRLDRAQPPPAATALVVLLGVATWRRRGRAAQRVIQITPPNARATNST